MSDFRDELEINKYELADLLEDHPNKFLKYAEAHADAIEERDKLKSKYDLEKSQAKDDLELVRAQLELKILTNYKDHGLSKSPSDKLREVWVISRDEYQKALDNYRFICDDFNKAMAEAEHKINVLKGAKEAFEHRKSSMDNLTKLMVNGFYSAKLPTELKEEIENKRERELEERSREKTNETIKRRARRKQGE